MLGSAVALLCGLPPMADGFAFVRWNTPTFSAYVVLRRGVALRRRLAPPTQRFTEILSNALASGIEHAEVMLCADISLLSGFEIPLEHNGGVAALTGCTSWVVAKGRVIGPLGERQRDGNDASGKLGYQSNSLYLFCTSTSTF